MSLYSYDVSDDRRYGYCASADGIHRHIYEIEGGSIVRQHYAFAQEVESSALTPRGPASIRTPLFPGSAYAWSIVRFDAEWDRLSKGSLAVSRP